MKPGIPPPRTPAGGQMRLVFAFVAAALIVTGFIAFT